jgi:two-component system sensor histidine kinase HydH
MASAGTPPPSWSALESAASMAIEKGVPTTVGAAEGRVIVAAPLIVTRGPAGALVIETPARVEPAEDDLDLLALFSSQAAVAIRNTHELERLRSGALAALGRMATQVAHELRNPLAGLRLYARHLEQRLDRSGDGESATLARKITSTIDHLASIVSEITAFGRPPELHRTPTALAPLLEECIALAEARHPVDTIEIIRNFDAACPEAELDGRELRKAFLNLLLNAVEALEGQGQVTVTTSYAAASRSITVTVEDTGVGMNDETLSRVFDLFFTTKSEGTGLGMSIVRSVVDLHGGELDVQSAPGRGTRVRVRLPVSAPRGDDAA